MHPKFTFLQRKCVIVIAHGTEYNMRYIFRVLIFLFPYSGEENNNKKIRKREIYPNCTSNMR